MEVNAPKGSGKLQQVITIGRHQLLSDAPEALGGENSGPEPHDLLAAALAACTTLTVTMYARRTGRRSTTCGCASPTQRGTASARCSAISTMSARSARKTDCA